MDEIKLVKSKLPTGRTSSYWIGLKKSDSTWKWTDGSTTTDANWAQGEPSGDGECVTFDHTIINSNESYPWNDQPCYAHHRYVCEIP